jgi:hypothetical protein
MSTWDYITGDRKINTTRRVSPLYDTYDKFIKSSLKRSESQKRNWRLVRENLKNE